MKKLFSVLAALCLVFTAAGSALAAFDYGADSSLGISITDKNTVEFGFDLGVLGADFLLTDTDVTLANAGDLNYVGDFVGIYTGTSEYEVAFGLGIDTTPTISGSNIQNFINGVRDVFNFGYDNTSPFTLTAPAAQGTKSYTNKLSGGNYGGLLTGALPSYEVELDFTGGFSDVYMYEYDAMNNAWDYGTIRLYADGSAVLNPTSNPVPVPAAVWLLGSGLLGLIGIRRRNA